jgi:hypothetical protein
MKYLYFLLIFKRTKNKKKKYQRKISYTSVDKPIKKRRMSKKKNES